MKRGLVVGKFSPLHKGHEYLIETALKNCDHLLILSYSNPEFKGCDGNTRYRWLNALYGKLSQVKIFVIDPRYLGLPLNNASDELQQNHLKLLLRFVCDYQPDYLFCSEPWGEACAKVIGAQAIIVDEARKAVPISATQIRQDPWAHAPYLSNEVLASFVKRIVFLGGESTGKTTLATALCTRLGALHVPEYGRELYIEKNGKLDQDDLVKIAQTQVEREDILAQVAASKGCKYILCDTSPLTTLGYNEWMFGKHSPELWKLAYYGRAYDGIILCGTDNRFIQDGTRVSEEFRNMQQAWYIHELKLMYPQPPTLIVRGSLEQRLIDSLEWIKTL